MAVHIHRLANGFTIAAEPMAEVETIAVGVHVDCGARHETEALNGLAHLFEHMVFKGAGGRDARGIAEAIEDVGGYLNAYTARDHTVFHARLLAGDLALGVGLIADLVRRPHLDAADLVREKDVVLQELGEARDTPDDIIYDHLQATAFPRQSFGRPVLGNEETIARIGVSALSGWIGAHYRPGSMVLAAAGRLDMAALIALAEAHFGDMPAGTAPRAEPAVYGGGAFADKRRFEQAHIALGYPAPGVHDPAYLPTMLFSSLAGEGSSSRLFQSLREERGLAYSVGSAANGWSDAGLFSVYLATARRDGAGALALARSILHEAAEGVTARELARAKAQARSGILMALESVEARAQRIGQQLLIHGRVIPAAEIVARIDAVALEDVRAAAQAMLAGPETLATVGGALTKAA